MGACARLELRVVGSGFSLRLWGSRPIRYGKKSRIVSFSHQPGHASVLAVRDAATLPGVRDVSPDGASTLRQNLRFRGPEIKRFSPDTDTARTPVHSRNRTFYAGGRAVGKNGTHRTHGPGWRRGEKIGGRLACLFGPSKWRERIPMPGARDLQFSKNVLQIVAGRRRHMMEGAWPATAAFFLLGASRNCRNLADFFTTTKSTSRSTVPARGLAFSEDSNVSRLSWSFFLGWNVTLRPRTLNAFTDN